MTRYPSTAARLLLPLLALLLTPTLASAHRVTATPADWFIDAPGPVYGRVQTAIRPPTDNVDIFSGALCLTQPIWSAPQRGDLSLSLQLVFNSKNWDSRSWGVVQDDTETAPNEFDPGHKWDRIHDSWVGIGFTLSLGCVARSIVFPDALPWTYIDELGSRHTLYSVGAAPGGGTTYVTRDSTYIKAVYDAAADTWTLYFADGIIGEFAYHATAPNDDADEAGGWYLTRKRDRYGNSITATYKPPPAMRGALDTITDSCGRVIHFEVYPPGDGRSGHLHTIDAPAFNGQRAITTIDSQSVTITETRDHLEKGGTGPVTRSVPAVSTITRPEGLQTSFEPPPEYGAPVAVTYPTGERIEYTSGTWEFLDFDVLFGDFREFSIEAAGIVGVDKYADGDPTNHSPTNWSHWTYTRGAGYVIDGPPCENGEGEGGGLGSQWGRVDVVAPDGNTTRYQFVLRRPGLLLHQAPYILAGREIVRRVFEGECHDITCDGVDQCASREVLRVISAYEQDGDIPEGNQNLRKVGETVFLRDGAGWASTTTSSCGWNGFGAYAASTQTATGSLAHGAVTDRTTYTPDPASWLLTPWVTASTQQSRPGQTLQRRVRQEARFDGYGHLATLRSVASLDDALPADCPLAPSAVEVPPDAARCLWVAPQCHTGALLASTPDIPAADWPAISFQSAQQQAADVNYSAGDIRTSYTYSGTAGEGLGKIERVERDRALGTPNPRTDVFTWSAGALATRARANLDPPWYALHRDVDSSTGLTASSYSPAGVETEYTYDLLGRITSIAPQDEAPIVTAYPTPTRQVETRAAADGTSAEYYESDGFGRLVRQERRQADGTLAFKRYEYDSSSRLVHESRWQDVGGGTEFLPLPEVLSWITTSYSYTAPGLGTIQDALGRVHAETYGAGTQVSYEYPSASATRAVRFGLNGNPSSMVSSVAERNGLYQIVRIAPEQAGGAVGTYAYDVLGSLSRAEVSALVGTQPFTQIRTWTRNGLGHLTQRVTPEAGVSDFLEYDIDGNLLRLRDATAAANGYDLVRTYDLAGRLLSLSKTNASSGATLAVLSVFGYDGAGSSCPGAYDLGRLTHESAPLPRLGGTYDRCIRYGGPGGRADRVHVVIDAPTLSALPWFFDDGLTWTDRGLLAAHDYPTIPIYLPGEGCGYLPASCAHNDYSRGYLIHSTFPGASATVSRWAPDGSVLDLSFGNNTRHLSEQDALDRVARISVVDGDNDVLWSSGDYRYDGLGQIIGIGDQGTLGTHPETFQYDPHGRLLQATMPGVSVAYSYDAFGNMTSRSPASLGWPTQADGGFSNRHYYVGTTHDNRVHDTGFNYAPAGALTSAPGPQRIYVCDEQERLVSVADGQTLELLAQFDYDALGERLIQKTAAGTTYYHRAGGSTVLGEFVWNASLEMWQADRSYAQGPDGEYAYVRQPGDVTYYGDDHLGSPRTLTDALGAVEAVELYEPFGLEPSPEQESTNTHRFAGHERDSATDLDYMHARYYSSRLARFISADKIAAEPQSPGRWNAYVYAGNDPMAYVDPDGREIVYASKPQEARIKAAAARSPTLRATLDPYDKPAGEGPRLEFKQGQVAPDASGQPATGNTHVEATEENGKTVINSVTVTTLPTNDEEAALDRETHEVGHVDDAGKDLKRYNDDAKHTSDTGGATPHDERPEEVRANGYASQVKKEIKDHKKQEKKEKKEEKKEQRKKH